MTRPACTESGVFGRGLRVKTPELSLYHVTRAATLEFGVGIALETVPKCKKSPKPPSDRVKSRSPGGFEFLSTGVKGEVKICGQGSLLTVRRLEIIQPIIEGVMKRHGRIHRIVRALLVPDAVIRLPPFVVTVQGKDVRLVRPET